MSEETLSSRQAAPEIAASKISPPQPAAATSQAPVEPRIEILKGEDRFQPIFEGPAPAVAPRNEEKPPEKHKNQTLMGALQSLAVTIVIALFVITFITQAFQIPSESMEDTLLVGDYLLVDKVHFAHGGVWQHLLPYSDFKRGDIIVFRYPVNPTQHFVKRVIGLPGDRIRLSDKRVWINDRPLNDRAYAIHRNNHDQFRDNFPISGSYIPEQIEARWWSDLQHDIHGGEITVPQNSYFVLGDNREDSQDSRYWGFVPRENIVGRPLLIYFSVDRPTVSSATGEADGKLTAFGVTLAQFWEGIRWNRALRVVY